MTIYKEVDYTEFEFWGGALNTVTFLTDQEGQQIFDYLEEILETPSETDINDFFWFEDDRIAEWLGYDDWEDLEADRT